MFFKTLVSKSLLMILIIAATVLGGGVKVEAASASWSFSLSRFDIAYGNPTPTYYTNANGEQFLSPMNLNSTDWTLCSPLTNSWDVTSYCDSGYTAQWTRPLNWTVAQHFVQNVDYYSVYGPTYLVPVSSYTGSTNKDVYAPGEVVNVSSLTAYTSYKSANGGSWSQAFCIIGLFGGCGYTPVGVEVSASFGGSQIASCYGAGSASCSGSFTAPTVPGTYSINLSGCYSNSSQCAASSIPFVVYAAAPAVNIFFSFLDTLHSLAVHMLTA